MDTVNVEEPQLPNSESSEEVGRRERPIEHRALLPRANDVIKRNAAWSAGVGLLPLPLLDLALLSGVQLKMIRELCRVYGLPFEQALARPIVMSLLGSLGAGVLAPILTATTLKLLPGVAILFSGASLSATSAGITYAVGHIFLDHFKEGGTLENFNIIAGRSDFKRRIYEAAEV
jgi:uncharacterized protein (DUF697 family)